MIALKGEYQPFTFSVFCREGCKKLSIELSSPIRNRDTGSELGEDRIEIHRLKIGNASYGIQDWILNPVRDEEEIGEIQGLVRFWMTVHVPEDANPGIYEGTLTLTQKGSDSVDVPIHLNVIPQRLECPLDVQFSMLYTVSPFGQYFKPEKYELLAPQVLSFYKELRAHGMTSLSPKCSDWPYRKGNIDGLKAEIDLATKTGLKGPVLWYMSALINGAKGGKRYAHYDGKCDNWDETRDISNLKEIITTVKAFERKKKWPELIFITVDEPGTCTEPSILNLRMDILGKTLKTVNELGARGATTLTELLDDRHNKQPFVAIPDELRKQWYEIRPYCPIRIYGYGYPQGITNLFAEMADSEKRGHEVWFYNNEATMGKNRYVARIFFGLWGWKVGARGLASWTYPGRRTVQWEVVREGIDDLKYLRLIQRLLYKKPKENTSRIMAEEFLKNVSNSVMLDENGFILDWNKWKAFDFVSFRLDAAMMIDRLL
ncbi:MAG: hypothetical protein SWO11_03850 [Thermodesulfobacteriota bacterium]|nr:hypothetical protein [Thermodesulfobacteriota bacterium]